MTENIVQAAGAARAGPARSTASRGDAIVAAVTAARATAVARKTLIIERCDLFAALLALVHALFGWRVRAIDEVWGRTPTRLEKIIHRLLKVDLIRSCDVAENFDYRMFQPVSADLTDAILDRPSARRLLAVGAPMMGDRPDDPARLRITMFTRLCHALAQVARMQTLADHWATPAPVIYLPRLSLEVFLAILADRKALPGIRFPRLILFVGGVKAMADAAGKAAAAAINRLRGLARRAGARAADQGAAKPETSGKAVNFGARVLMFTHGGTDYGDLFSIDYFYRPETDHPFHKDNIQFLEHTDPADATYGLLHPAQRGRLRSLLSTMTAAIRRYGGGFWRPSLAILAMIMTSKINSIRRYETALSRFPDAAVAILGFDILCPRELTIAAQNRGITCIAAQERLNSLLTRIHTVITDHYFVMGRATAEKIRDNRNARIGTCHEIGPIRADWIDRRAAGRVAPSGRRMVLVLDALSWAPDGRADRLINTSWENNALFLERILELAAQTPDLDFVIRGKNADWMKIGYFDDLVARIEATRNVEIDRNYETKRRSYDLVNDADLMIARYTSLGDEALARGVPVIFYEETVNGDTYQGWICDYSGLPVYARNARELKTMTQAVIDGTGPLDPRQWRDLVDGYFGGHDGGGAQARLHEVVDRIAGQKSLLPEAAAASGGNRS